MKYFDWQQMEDGLFQQSKQAIERFAYEHMQEQCSFLAYGWMGDEDNSVYLCIDTPEQAIHSAQQVEQDALIQRSKLMGLREAWRVASSWLTEPKIIDYAPSVELFKYDSYMHFRLDNWDELINQKPYPEHKKWEDDYLYGNMQLLFWKCIERLINEHVLDMLKLASPFRLGYQFHEEDIVVLRILNWPG